MKSGEVVTRTFRPALLVAKAYHVSFTSMIDGSGKSVDMAGPVMEAWLMPRQRKYRRYNSLIV